MSNTQRAPWPLLLTALVITGAVVAVIRITQQPLAADFGIKSPCHEDEALIWIDAPRHAACVPLDNLEEAK